MLQCRNGSWRTLFWHNGKKHAFWIGEVEEYEARAVAAKVDYWLMRLKQRLVDLPAGCDIVTFLKHDGKRPTTIHGYLETIKTLKEMFPQARGPADVSTRMASDFKRRYAATPFVRKRK